MKYKNCGVCEKTFQGVTFKPGEIHEVDNYITAKNFIRVEDEIESSDFKRKRVGRPPKEDAEVTTEDETKQPASSFNLTEDKKDGEEK